MLRLFVILGFAFLSVTANALADALIVADEFPAMEFLAAKLNAEEKITAKIVAQKDFPESLKGVETVVVYIHGVLQEKVENALIDYATGGGKVVLLHHSISSGKRKNAHWFSFLGVKLPEGELDQGGYKWIGEVSWDLVNLCSDHWIMTNHVKYPLEIPYTNSAGPTLPGFTLHQSEVYLNHVLTGPRTILMGLKYRDEKTEKTYMQASAGWIKDAGKGQVIYLMPGHSTKDFEQPAYLRIVLNAVSFRQPKLVN